MKAVLKNHVHGSDIVLSKTLAVPDNQEAYYFKSSSTKDGLDVIEREYTGLNWYLEKREVLSRPTVLIDTGHYKKIQVKAVDGTKPDIRQGYWANKEIVEATVRHYCEIWGQVPNKDMSPIHGDLSLAGNIISTKAGPYIIDWEHFVVEGGPIGFDILYFLIELLLLTSDGKLPSQQILAHMQEMLSYLKGRDCLSSFYSKNYLSSIIDFIEQDEKIWKKQKYKIPLRLYKKTLVKKIESNLV